MEGTIQRFPAEALLRMSCPFAIGLVDGRRPQPWSIFGLRAVDQDEVARALRVRDRQVGVAAPSGGPACIRRVHPRRTSRAGPTTSRSASFVQQCQAPLLLL
jgi:hypothetical protein